jgi:hypothetical protein
LRRIDSIFNLHRARSDIFSRYDPGDVPYIGNGLGDNAVVGLVTPLPVDKVFPFNGVVVSAFCEATVQAPPFVACGRAGNGLVVLEPKQPMKIGQLASVAAYLNAAVRWRFSWYWQTTSSRLERILLPDSAMSESRFSVRSYLPSATKPVKGKWKLGYRDVPLGVLFDLRPGDYHVVGHLPKGDIPMVSCGDLNNGICGHFAVTSELHDHQMTIAFNGSTLSAKYHPYKFAAKDDVAVCTPKMQLRLTTLLFIQVMLQREKWRFSYYRKCFKEKLERVTVQLPVTEAENEIDEDLIASIVEATPHWDYLSARLA